MLWNALDSPHLRNTTSSEARNTEMNYKIIQGDCREALKQVDSDSVHTCVTSPPYFSLRSYFSDGVILKKTISDEKKAEILAELVSLGVLPI